MRKSSDSDIKRKNGQSKQWLKSILTSESEFIAWNLPRKLKSIKNYRIVAQVAGIDINKWKLLEDNLKRYISLQNYNSVFVKQISDYIIVFICGYATCATIG